MAFPSDPASLDGRPFYRLCSQRFTVFEGTGAYLKGGRWTPPGQRVIYCGSSLALCAMEVMVHLNTSVITSRFHFAEGNVQSRYGVEIMSPAALEAAGCRWQLLDDVADPQAIGEGWYERGEALFLVVPTVLSPRDFTVIINQDHPDFDALGLDAAVSERYVFDGRFGRG